MKLLKKFHTKNDSENKKNAQVMLKQPKGAVKQENKIKSLNLNKITNIRKNKAQKNQSVDNSSIYQSSGADF